MNVVLDVGANGGQYGAQLRSIGYGGRIVSFEPLPGPFASLTTRIARDPEWSAVNIALGERDGDATIHVAANLVSSSFLPVLPAHVAVAPESVPVRDLVVPIRRLDSVFDEHVRRGDRAFLKIDAQGYERKVLDGGPDSLARLTGLQLELSLVPLYEDAPPFAGFVEDLERQGFSLMSLEPGFADPASGRMLQVDGIFFREAG